MEFLGHLKVEIDAIDETDAKEVMVEIKTYAETLPEVEQVEMTVKEELS